MADREEVIAIAREAAREAVTEAAREAARHAAHETAMDREEIREVVTEAVRQTLIQLGIQSNEPIEMQKDFQHLRKWRQAGEDMRGKGMVAVLTLTITGGMTLLLLGLKEWFSS